MKLADFHSPDSPAIVSISRTAVQHLMIRTPENRQH